jgi:hypothetical protein
MGMSALGWAWGRRGITPVARLVLITLADSASPEGDCYFVFSHLRELTGLNEFGLIHALAELQRLGLIMTRPMADSPIFQIACDRNG